MNTRWEEPGKEERSRIATSRLSRKIQKLLASLAPGEVRAYCAPSRAPTTEGQMESDPTGI